jgi:hypothetical protein
MRDAAVLKTSVSRLTYGRSRRSKTPLQTLRTFLELFYSRAGLPLPRLEKLEAEGVPLPYRKLLVHSTDLTPTLESYYRQDLALTVLSRWREGDTYIREVVLRLAGDGNKVGYGAIRILLNHLPAPAVARVLEEQTPFGSILQTEGIPHLSWPQAFFRAQADSHIEHALGQHQASFLYGRRNVLLDGSRRLLAEVVELLAPVPRDQHEKRARTNIHLPGNNGASVIKKR